MKSSKRRLVALCVLAGGFLFASSCSAIAEQVIETVLFAFNIVDVWV